MIGLLIRQTSTAHGFMIAVERTAACPFVTVAERKLRHFADGHDGGHPVSRGLAGAFVVDDQQAGGHIVAKAKRLVQEPVGDLVSGIGDGAGGFHRVGQGQRCYGHGEVPAQLVAGRHAKFDLFLTRALATGIAHCSGLLVERVTTFIRRQHVGGVLFDIARDDQRKAPIEIPQRILIAGLGTDALAVFGHSPPPRSIKGQTGCILESSGEKSQAILRQISAIFMSTLQEWPFGQKAGVQEGMKWGRK